MKKPKKLPKRIYIYIVYENGKEIEKSIRSTPHLKKAIEDTGIIGEMLN